MRPRRFRLALLAAAGLAALAGFVLAGRLLGRPDAAVLPAHDPVAGVRAQQRVAEVLLRGGGVAVGDDPIILTLAELNALLARYVDSRRLGVQSLAARSQAGWLEVAGRTTPRSLLTGSALSSLVSVLPDALLDLDLWVGARGRLEVREGEGEFVVSRTTLGRQPVPPRWIWRMLRVDPRRQLTWRLPRVVERIDVEPDRLVIHTRARGS
ncbi:MAG TPA: hypothetical protein VGW35_23125 [Methylomirabilota bacterium]|jgi:hypothetical protein|nr:hypothetical protein [Methylomirabilota bacterium]